MYCPSVHEKCGHSKLKLFRTVELFKGRISHEASHNIEQLHLFIHSAHSTSHTCKFLAQQICFNTKKNIREFETSDYHWVPYGLVNLLLQVPTTNSPSQHVENLEARDKSPNLLISVALGSIPHQVLASARDSAKPPVARNIMPTPGAWYRYYPVVLKFTQALVF